jgi:3-phenylpropionate/trans-cinnamate dioxygenase ferredoxin component
MLETFMPFTTVAKVGEIAEGQGKQITVSGKTLALFHCQGAYYAIDNTCPHRGAPLAEGFVDQSEVTCPWHAARFDLKTGSHLSPPAPRGVTAYKVQVVGQDIQVDV